MEKKILVIEDSQVLAFAYSLPFQRRGYQVQIVGDGRAALGLLRTFQPDAVLLDLILPKVPGSVILEAIRLNPAMQNLPVVLFTNALLRPNEEERLRKLATRFFHKAQTSPEQIAKVVEELLGASALAAEKEAAAQSEPVVPLPVPPTEVPKPKAPISAEAASPKAMVSSGPACDAAVPSEAAPVAPSRKPDGLPPVEAMPPAEAPPTQPEPEDLERVLQDIEAHARKLVTEQNEDQRTAMLGKMAERWHGSGLSAQAGDAGRLAKVLEDLVADLLANPKFRSTASIRTLLQACPILQKLLKLARTPGRTWNPPFTKTLVVDDSGVSLRSVTKALEAIRLTCVGVANPLEALQMLATNPFDLVMLDVDMPQLTGPEVCKKLRGLPLHAKTPVIFLTSLNRFDVRMSTAQSGGDDFVTKPFMPSELAVKALTHIFRRQMDAAQGRNA